MKKIKVGCKQVLDFMKKEGWYTTYKNEVIKYTDAIDDPDNPRNMCIKRALLRCLFCFNGIDTIVDNLDWGATSDGFAFWNEKYQALEKHFRYIDLKYKTVESQ